MQSSDTYSTEGIECPACNHVHTDDLGFMSDGVVQRMDCEGCGKPLAYSMNITYNYYAEIDEDD